MKMSSSKATKPSNAPRIGLTSRTRRATVSHLPTRQMPLALVHPAFRRFFRRPKKWIKKPWNNLWLAARIRNRTLRYHPLPRVAPFFCHKCRFSSYYAHAIKNHVCSRRASTVYSFEREEKVAASGFRCKSKNALAVMERARNPTVFSVHKLHTSAAERNVPSYNVPPLSLLAYRAVNVQRNVVSYPTNFIFKSSKTIHRPYPSSVTHRTNVFYCKYCKRLFYEHFAYYQHFEQTSCKMPAHEEDVIQEKVAASGFRCKSKNALAVMERARNPTVFSVHKLHTSAAERNVPSYNVPPLSLLAYRAVNVQRNVVSYPTNFIFKSSKTIHRPYPSSVTHRTNVFYCKYCKRLFYEHFAYYQHFEQTSCKMPAHEEDVIRVQCRGAECVPAEYEYGRRECLVTLQSDATTKCTACGISSLEFASRGEFHEHLFKCKPVLSTKQN
ncbi:hypothetical protein Tcan_17468 [Toxocara canis]|uniref:Uncharacterized protein n=1 Tax=Toxocara canis TaxID=6265 RepID=A0A0B2VP09_TOXCA|nr:hypothetical protein Tcan_17468 [Toxocara canis]